MNPRALFLIGISGGTLAACAHPQTEEPKPAGCELAPNSIDTAQRYRIRDGLLFGEKATSALENQRQDAPVPGLCGVRQLRPGQRVNAVGALDVYIQNSETYINGLRERGYNLILSPEIRRAGEVNWLRIEAPNRYYRRIVAADVERSADQSQPPRVASEGADLPTDASSQPNLHKTTPGCLKAYKGDLSTVGLEPRAGDPLFLVSRIELDRNQWLREGAWVPAFFFYDLVQRYDCPYLRDLRAAARQSRPVLSLSLPELPVVGAQNSPQLYRARGGDRLRLRILVAEQDVRQRDRVLELLNAERLPDVPAYRLTTHLTLADDVEFVVAEYGLKLQVVPAVSYAARAGNAEADQFNPIKTAPGITSAFYLQYEGRRHWLSVLQWIPGTFVSLLALKGEDTKFTAGFSWAPLPLRSWINLVYGWHDLRVPVVGVAISPNVDFKAMLARDAPGR